MNQNAKDGTPYDFRKPRQLDDDIESLLGQWQRALAAQSTEAWELQLGLAIAWEYESADTTQIKTVATGWESDDAPGLVIAAFGFEGEADGIAVVIPRALIVGSITDLLGETVEELPEDRPLSDLELSVVEMACQQLARQLTDSQPCSRPLICEFRGLLQVRDCVKKFNGQEPIVETKLRLSTSFGEATASCLIAQEAVLTLLTRVSECRPKNDDAHRIQETLKDLPISLVVELGESEIGVADLMNMQPGDVIILEQRVNEPLSVRIGEQAKFRAWPGRVGNRQAIQISELIELEAN